MSWGADIVRAVERDLSMPLHQLSLFDLRHPGFHLGKAAEQRIGWEVRERSVGESPQRRSLVEGRIASSISSSPSRLCGRHFEVFRVVAGRLGGQLRRSRVVAGHSVQERDQQVEVH